MRTSTYAEIAQARMGAAATAATLGPVIADLDYLNQNTEQAF